MAFDVSTFRSKMTGDGARPNLFEVSIPNATGFWTQPTEFSFFCRSTSIPGSSIGTVVTPYMGREVKFAGNRTFADWTITIINDQDFVIREAMESWMGNINSHVTNLRGGTGTNNTGYVTTANVKQLGKKSETPIRTYNFVNIFPTDISEITLDWGDNDSIEEFTVTFAYDYWLVDSDTDLPADVG